MSLWFISTTIYRLSPNKLKKKRRKQILRYLSPIANRIIFREVNEKEERGAEAGEDDFFASALEPGKRSALIIPQTVREQQEVFETKVGEAVFVGPGIWEHGFFVATTVVVGDKFIYNPLSVDATFTHEGEQLNVIGEHNIIARLAR